MPDYLETPHEEAERLTTPSNTLAERVAEILESDAVDEIRAALEADCSILEVLSVSASRSPRRRYELSTGDHNETDSTLGEFLGERFDSCDDARSAADWLNEHYAGIGDPLRARVVEVLD
tara:strand:+ start:4909 stop:5268 length:360 start_codon:yes stop_codon:yes gene_type:complete